ncbi:rhomboid family intramembrane serine protease [Parvularcula sp. LCG005]|uniref:rhomboid family intramembrane serine protease n=1 Tax=Parvularcula sp. LCG005 TaxID=3078805 RepID=UPI0029433BA2|nr:rhomboid family intramembrane serine protease [Parvularcula sp. LCG005]WOI54160.1 rhomboid family intramembrane serine protease [Parvularcula sp. LCG005]
MSDPFSERPSERRRSVSPHMRWYNPSGDGAAISMPKIVAILLGLMVAIFVIQLFLSDRANFWVDYTMGLSPRRFFARLEGGEDSFTIMTPLFTHIFLHGNFAHLLFNGLWLIVFGTGVARRMAVESEDGGDRFANNVLFLTFFLASGVVGALFFLIPNKDSIPPLIGASGAISGLMAGGMRIALGRDPMILPGQGALTSMFARPVLIASAVYIGINILTGLGVVMGGMGKGLSIAWEAHIGGYVFGLLTFPLFDGLVRRPRVAAPPWQ